MSVQTNNPVKQPTVGEIDFRVFDLEKLLDARIQAVQAVAEAKAISIEATITLHDRRYEERFKAMDEKTSLALTASEKAVTKAEIATEKRFDAVNEFRGTLSDQAATLIPRSEAAARFESYDDKIEEIKKEVVLLREYRSSNTGRSQGSGALLSNIVAGVSIVYGLVMTIVVFFRH